MVSEPKTTTTEVKMPHIRLIRLRLIAIDIMQALMTASAGDGGPKTPRASSIDASTEAPLDGVEFSGIVESKPVTTNGFTIFCSTPASLGITLVDGTLQGRSRSDANVRRGTTSRSAIGAPRTQDAKPGWSYAGSSRACAPGRSCGRIGASIRSQCRPTSRTHVTHQPGHW
jgi:hypothetical protein